MCNEDYLNNLIQFRGNVRILNKITLSFDNLTLEYGYSNENIKIIDKKGGGKKIKSQNVEVVERLKIIKISFATLFRCFAFHSTL